MVCFAAEHYGENVAKPAELKFTEYRWRDMPNIYLSYDVYAVYSRDLFGFALDYAQYDRNNGPLSQFENKYATVYKPPETERQHHYWQALRAEDVRLEGETITARPYSTSEAGLPENAHYTFRFLYKENQEKVPYQFLSMGVELAEGTKASWWYDEEDYQYRFPFRNGKNGDEVRMLQAGDEFMGFTVDYIEADVMSSDFWEHWQEENVGDKYEAFYMLVCGAR